MTHLYHIGLALQHSSILYLSLMCYEYACGDIFRCVTIETTWSPRFSGNTSSLRSGWLLETSVRLRREHSGQVKDVYQCKRATLEFYQHYKLSLANLHLEGLNGV